MDELLPKPRSLTVTTQKKKKKSNFFWVSAQLYLLQTVGSDRPEYLTKL